MFDPQVFGASILVYCYRGVARILQGPKNMFFLDLETCMLHG